MATILNSVNLPFQSGKIVLIHLLPGKRLLAGTMYEIAHDSIHTVYRSPEYVAMFTYPLPGQLSEETVRRHEFPLKKLVVRLA